MMQNTAAHSLTLDDIVHRYGDALAVDHVTLEVNAGELVALLGPSGCGKTTLLRIIAGFIGQTSGKVSIGDRRVDELAPAQRNIGIVFQNYALFPHMTVAENIGYGLAARKVDKPAIHKRVKEMLELVQLGHLAERQTRQLSGGQQQRVALARALAIEPKVLLLDEPFSALDKSLRLDMQMEIKRIQRSAGTTALIVTHDQEEALGMADRVAVFSQGRLEQFAPAAQVYDQPASLFVNQFVGTANVLPGVLMEREGSQVQVQLDEGVIWSGVCRDPALSVGARVVACVRPENLHASESAVDALPGKVELGMPLGASSVHEICTPNGLRLKLSGARLLGASLHPVGASLSVKPASAACVNVFTHP